jgi:hypothetical protein
VKPTLLAEREMQFHKMGFPSHGPNVTGACTEWSLQSRRMRSPNPHGKAGHRSRPPVVIVRLTELHEQNGSF